jgi:hypothetical protein
MMVNNVEVLHDLITETREEKIWVDKINHYFAEHPLILRGQSIANLTNSADYQSSIIGCTTTHLDYLDHLGLSDVRQYLQHCFDLMSCNYLVLIFNKATPTTKLVLSQHQNTSLAAMAKKNVPHSNLKSLKKTFPDYVRLLYLSQPEDMQGGELGFQHDYYPEKDHQYIEEHSFRRISPQSGKVVTFAGDLIHAVFPYQSQLPYPSNSRNSFSIELYQLPEKTLTYLAECVIVANDTDKIRLGDAYSISRNLTGGDGGLHLHQQLQKQSKFKHPYISGSLAEEVYQPLQKLLTDPLLSSFYVPIETSYSQGTLVCDISAENKSKDSVFHHLDQICFQLVGTIIQDPASRMFELLKPDTIQDSGYQIYQIQAEQWLFFGELQQQQGQLVYQSNEVSQSVGFDLLVGLDASPDQNLEVHFVYLKHTLVLQSKKYLLIPRHPMHTFYLHNSGKEEAQLMRTQISSSE